MTALPKRKKYTPEEYLALEEKAEFRIEYVDGYVFKSAGGTEAHNDITLNVASRLRTKLRGKCKTYANDMKVWVEEAGTFFYPDVTVVCGKRKFYRGNTGIVENPVLLIEVLSDSTEAKDRGEKLLAYRTLESLREYVLVS